MFPVSTIMTTEVVTVSPEMPIYEALDILTRKRVSGMPVVDSLQRVVGVLSEKDLLRILIGKELSPKDQVSDFMSREVICFTEDDNAVEICKFFMRTHFRRVPIVRDGRLVGIVSRRDIVALITEAKTKMSTMRYV